MYRFISRILAWVFFALRGGVLEENPLRGLARGMYRRGWFSLRSIAYPLGYRIRYAGVRWETEEELALLLKELVDTGFFEVNKENPEFVRLNPLIVVR